MELTKTDEKKRKKAGAIRRISLALAISLVAITGVATSVEASGRAVVDHRIDVSRKFATGTALSLSPGTEWKVNIACTGPDRSSGWDDRLSHRTTGKCYLWRTGSHSYFSAR